MNKTAIKNFAIWARNKLIADISYKAGLLGITEKRIKSPLPQSTQTVQFFDIGTKEPSSITGLEIQQRKKLVEEIERKAKQSDHTTAYKNVIEEVAYTWFNRLIAIRFMEVNDYLPTRIRVLSSESNGKAEPDLVTHALEANLDYSAYEKDRIIQLKHENKLDDLFRMLFIKQCNALNLNLPKLFEKTNDYTELLLNVSFTDKEGVIYHLVNDIQEDDFNVTKEGQVEIIGWLYQYYNTEQNELVYDGSFSKTRITKELLPAATTIYTPDWAVRYMVENSLGSLWLEANPSSSLVSNWKYLILPVDQEIDSKNRLNYSMQELNNINPQDIKIIDPCMGSGHILVYVFEILMQIYESTGFSKRDATKAIINNNIYGLDIDDRAFQLAYFSILMIARQYNRRILNETLNCHIYSIQESNTMNRNHLNYLGNKLPEKHRKEAIDQIENLLRNFLDAKEYGSIISIDKYDWDLMIRFISDYNGDGQISIDTIGIESTRQQLQSFIEIGQIMEMRYDVVVTNPPYLGSTRFSAKLDKYVKEKFKDEKADLSMVMFKRAMDGYSKKGGFISFITTSSWMFLSSFQKTRNYMLNNFHISSIVDFGTELFDGKVGHNPIVSWVIRNRLKNSEMVAVRLVEYCYSRRDEKEPEFFNKSNHYVFDQRNFSKIPGTPIAYWASEEIIDAFTKGASMVSLIEPKQGLATTDNNQFIRLWHEVPFNNISFEIKSISEATNYPIKWVPYNKGGSRRQWYGNYDYVVDWSNNGQAIKDNVMRKYSYLKTPDFVVKNTSYYFKESITWSLITSGGFSIRYREPGSIHDVSGMSAFSNNHKRLLYILGLLSTKIANYIFKMLNPTINLQVGDFNNFPVIIDHNRENEVIEIVNHCVELSRLEWNSFETSWKFETHPLIKYSQNECKLKNAFQTWELKSHEIFNQTKKYEEDLNRLFIDLYGLQGELDHQLSVDDVTLSVANISKDLRSFISFAIGCMFGRYSTDVNGLLFAGNKWDDSNYTSFVPDKDNIIPITDEEYFDDDIVGRFVDFLTVTFGQKDLEENLDFIAIALDAKGNSPREVIRNYFLKDFYKDHCQVYQKRPIYWLFDSGKQNGFKALIYMHRYDENTIGNMRIDYLHRMQRIYENEIARMQDTIENSKDAREVASATKRKEKLIKQLQETKEYDEKIAHLALARTSIDLDDGVKVNYEKVQTDRDGKKLDVLAKI